ncbi:hypothetical protein [Pseudomonas putida]|uniref:hypothetical protein n=1 Tax=Pseudomonas putida TaxID=303 RepID=UPI0024E148D5|nr:hypothetical protein [Pseudomonas putida]HDS0978962.1 hypothetical protein [Pseudomonas putida]
MKVIFAAKARPETDIANKHIAQPTLSSTMGKRKQKKGMRLCNTFPGYSMGQQERVA